MAGIVHNFDLDLQYRRHFRRERVIRDRTNPIDIYDDFELYERYRFARIDILELVDEIHGDIEHRTNWNAALSPLQQVLIALRFYAIGSYQTLTGDMLNVHKSTACRAIRGVSLALERRLQQHVYIPQDEDYVANTKTKFEGIAGFPSIIGCIDGTHIRIMRPPQHEWEYVNRKGYHSINVQLIRDADLRILNCVVRWPGSTHDARILTESIIYNHFEQSDMQCLLLGDSGYPQKQWLMTPFLRTANRSQEAYNNAHRVTRSVIERCNGVLKARFACILQKLKMSPGRACSVIGATIVLHNICINKNLPLPNNFQIPPAIDDAAIDIALPQRDVVRGTVRRTQIVQNFFNRE